MKNASTPWNEYERDYLNWYQRTTDTIGQPLDPTVLVHLARTQWSDRPELAEAFARCTRAWPKSELYTHFLSYPDHLKRWNHAGGFFLQHPTLGALVVDILHDANAPAGISIGGIEYLDRVMGHAVDVNELYTDIRALQHDVRAHALVA